MKVKEIKSKASSSKRIITPYNKPKKDRLNLLRLILTLLHDESSPKKIKKKFYLGLLLLNIDLSFSISD